MEIILEGKGSKYFTPNKTIFNLNFVAKSNTYEKVLEKGISNVDEFIEEVLIQNGFQKEDLKTRNFVIREETQYNNETHKQEFDGYSYNQYATISFDYNIDLMANIMNSISKLSFPLTYQINFGLKDEEKARKEVLKLAYEDAESKSKAIADAAGKTLKRCTKVDSKPFDNVFVSNTNLDYSMMSTRMINNIETITTIFTPEDIEIMEYLYCLWLAE